MVPTKTHRLDDDIERLLVVSDLHSHREPIEGFERARAKLDGRSQMLFNGDAFYGGPRPVEAATWIIEKVGDLATLGNHDVAMNQSEKNARTSEPLSPPYTEPGAYERLNTEQRDFFRGLPLRLEVTWRDRRIVLMHGHVNVDNTVVEWICAPPEQAVHFAEPDADLVVLSHSHWPYVVEIDGMRVANTGSLALTSVGVQQVGANKLHLQNGDAELPPGGGDLRSSFLSITEANGELVPEIIRFDYDREAALEDVIQSEAPDQEFRRRWLREGIMDFTVRPPM